MNQLRTGAIVLAAGKGTRMKSALPKVLHPLLGRPMVHHVVAAALEAGAGEVVVVIGHGADGVITSLREAFGDRVRIAVQPEQRGTGDAAAHGLAALSAEAHSALVLYGDTPLLRARDLRALLDAVEGSEATPARPLSMITTFVDDPNGYGRVIRDALGDAIAVREDRDCTAEQRSIREVNAGVYAASVSFLRGALPRLSSGNAQNELYLTDVVATAAGEGGVAALEAPTWSVAGVNDRAQLAHAERTLLAHVRDRWRLEGVTVGADVTIETGVTLGRDVELARGVVLRGTTRVGDGARIDVGCVIDNGIIDAGAQIKPYCVITDSHVGEGAQVGPFAHLRPKSDLGPGAHVGNFVETKNTTLGAGAKANHLAYLGDGDVGDGANVGAGTIFCNYDGFQKHRTKIGARAFIGSDSQLVAPVTIGEGAYVGTGTTVTEDVPANALAIGRARQSNKPGYANALREKLSAKKRAATQK